MTCLFFSIPTLAIVGVCRLSSTSESVCYNSPYEEPYVRNNFIVTNNNMIIRSYEDKIADITIVFSKICTSKDSIFFVFYGKYIVHMTDCKKEECSYMANPSGLALGFHVANNNEFEPSDPPSSEAVPVSRSRLRTPLPNITAREAFS